ncbi:MAG: hypothetical protein ABSA08_03850 [Acidimicrobiales bacterium]|jgi:hypothetical protein
MKSSLRVTATLRATSCLADGAAGDFVPVLHEELRLRPLFARPLARPGPVLCSDDPASSHVVKLTVTALPPPVSGAPATDPWAFRPSNGEVCLYASAAWAPKTGPFACLAPARPLADCPFPDPGTPWWSAACQDKATGSSSFTTHVVDTVWLWARPR